jgi:hypothetical protein
MLLEGALKIRPRRHGPGATDATKKAAQESSEKISEAADKAAAESSCRKSDPRMSVTEKITTKLLI